MKKNVHAHLKNHVPKKGGSPIIIDGQNCYVCILLHTHRVGCGISLMTFFHKKKLRRKEDEVIQLNIISGHYIFNPFFLRDDDGDIF